MIANDRVICTKTQTSVEGSFLPSFASSKEAEAKTTSFADVMQQSAKAVGVTAPDASTNVASSVGQQAQTLAADAGASTQTTPVLQEFAVKSPVPVVTQDDTDKAVGKKLELPSADGGVVSHKVVTTPSVKTNAAHEVEKKSTSALLKAGQASANDQDAAGGAPIVVGPIANPVAVLQPVSPVVVKESMFKPVPGNLPVKSPAQPIVGGPKAPVVPVNLQAASDVTSSGGSQGIAVPNIHAKLQDDLPPQAQAPGTAPVLGSGVAAPVVVSVATLGVHHAGVAAAPSVTSHMTGPTLQEPALTSVDSGKANQIEVGVRGGEFGWVKVRAELAPSGEVNTFLRGTSAETTHALTQQASTIHSYLGAQDLSVKSVQVEAPQSMQSAMDASGGEPRSQQEQNSTVSTNFSGETSEADDDFVMPSPLPAQPSISITGTGNWVSVRA